MNYGNFSREQLVSMMDGYKQLNDVLVARNAAHRARAALFEGKCAILRHENNKLRAANRELLKVWSKNE